MRYFKHKMMLKWVPECLSPAFLKSAKQIQQIVEKDQHRFTLHALERMIERKIQPAAIKETILNGEIIEFYPEDKYGPSCLIMGSSGLDTFHVLCSLNPVWIITAYNPAFYSEKCDKSFKKRVSL
ncbi:DUF4258 domain-containing protein [Desulfonatronospira thiodismutans]|nr:DUF4258 domain-containing protein [Desulfonatronospira thiodismutans]